MLNRTLSSTPPLTVLELHLRNVVSPWLGRQPFGDFARAKESRPERVRCVSVARVEAIETLPVRSLIVWEEFLDNGR